MSGLCYGWVCIFKSYAWLQDAGRGVRKPVQRKRQASEEEGTEPARHRMEVTAGAYGHTELWHHSCMNCGLTHFCMPVLGWMGWILSRCSVTEGLK